MGKKICKHTYLDQKREYDEGEIQNGFIARIKVIKQKCGQISTITCKTEAVTYGLFNGLDLEAASTINLGDRR